MPDIWRAQLAIWTRGLMQPFRRDQQSSSRHILVAALGITQILAWGSTFYLIGVLANPIASDTGWRYSWVVSGVSVGLLTAGVVGPYVGNAIGEWGGRPILASSAFLIACGLSLIGLSQTIVWYLAAWVIVGIGMGFGLTDAAFSTLARIYGKTARGAITSLTLFAGFSSTVCWPLSAYLVAHLGWRGTCFVYAAIQLGVALPILLAAVPCTESRLPPGSDEQGRFSDSSSGVGERATFALLAAVLTVSAAILSLVGVQLLTLLQAQGVELSRAVALGALVGPSQVGARVLELLAGRHYQPIWTMVASSVFVGIGTGLLLADLPTYSLALVIYGAGNGIASVARGTLPLALFGPLRYPMLMGRLSLFILLSMALSPVIGAMTFTLGGAKLTLTLLAAAGAVNVLLVSLLFMLSRRRTAVDGVR